MEERGPRGPAAEARQWTALIPVTFPLLTITIQPSHYRHVMGLKDALLPQPESYKLKKNYKLGAVRSDPILYSLNRDSPGLEADVDPNPECSSTAPRQGHFRLRVPGNLDEGPTPGRQQARGRPQGHQEETRQGEGGGCHV